MSTIIKTIKKLSLSLLVAILGFTATSSNTFALENQNYLSQEAIEIADPYVVNKDGHISISNSVELKQKISISEFDLIQDSINYSNHLIDEKVVDIKTNGTLYIHNEELSIQGGNINGTRLYWWGFHQYNDNNNTKTIVKKLRTQYKNSKSLSTRAMASLLGIATGAVGAVALNILPEYIGGKLNSFANAIEKANKGYGTILAVNWTIVGSNIKSQTKNTK